MNTQELHEYALSLFSKRSSFMLLCQDIAANFYVERADFTYQRTLGTEFAGDLMSSYPLYCRRDLGDQVGQMLRPTNKEWYHGSLADPQRETHEVKQYLQWTDKVMRRAMFDREAMFTRAAKEADHDYAAFGQSIMRVRLNKLKNGLQFTCYHLRDIAWVEDADQKLCFIVRKYKSSARDLKRAMPKISDKVEMMLSQNKPLEDVECMHMMVAADMWDGNANGKPWISIQYDSAHQFCMEEMPQWHKEYVISRWQTVSGSQYAFSPATICALPEARLLQAMTYTLLEAGEKSTNPPMVATHEAVKSDVAVYAGGITWVDAAYDERLGDALRPLTIDRHGLPFGAEMQENSKAMLMQAFYLNKLQLPQRTAEMTAYEVGQRVQEYIRAALPLFEPMEYECNGQLLDEVWDLMWRNGGFGSPMDAPRELQDADVNWQFVSPLHDALEQVKGQKFLEAKSMIAEAVALDQGAAALIDVGQALRDTLNGIGVPAIWVRSEVQVEDIKAQQAAAAQAQQTLAAMQQGADVAGTMATAEKDRAAAEAEQMIAA
jgi:hypothetical protein